MKIPVAAANAAFPRRRALRGLRWGVLFVLGCLLVKEAARVRFGLPATPLADEDVWGYLYPPLCKLTGGSFEHSMSRQWLYPGFLFVNLCLFNGFEAITRVQHGMGMLTGAILLAAWREWARLLPGPAPGFGASEVRRWVTGVTGLGLAGVYLLSRRSVLAEHALRPEAVFPFFAALHLGLTLGFLRRRWREGQPEAATAWGAGAIFVAVLLLLLRPAFGFAAGIVSLPVVVDLFSRGGNWRRRVRLVVVPGALAAVCLVGPEWWMARADRFSTFLMPAMRLAVHADLVRDQLAADLAHGDGSPPYDRAWLETLKERLNNSFTHSAEPGRRWLGFDFNPDYLVAVEPFYEGSFSADDAGDDALARFCDAYYWRVWRHQPGRMLAKVGREMCRFYRFDPRELRGKSLNQTVDPYTQQDSPRLSEDPYYPRTLRSLDLPDLRARRLDRSDAFRNQLTKCRQLIASGSARVLQPKTVGVVENLVRATYLPVLAGSLVAGLCLLGSRRGGPARGGVATGTVGVLYGYNFGMCLTVATVQSLVTQRYVEVQAVFTLFAWAAGLALIVAAISQALSQPNPGATGERSVPPSV